jgi:transposase
METYGKLRQHAACRSFSHGRFQNLSLAPHLKRERIVHDLLQQDKRCTGCAKDLRLIGEEASERYEYIPASLLVIEDVCLKYACDCTVRTAGKPA